MGLSTNSRPDTRQVYVLAAALFLAVLLLALAPGARGEASAQPKVGRGPTGAHVAGELLVAYRPGTSAQKEQAVVRGSGGRTAEHLPWRMRLLSFPSIKREKIEGDRERTLQRKLEDLRDDPRVETADYNHVYEAALQPDDPRFGGQWGLQKTRFPASWDSAKGTGTSIAIVDSGIAQSHPDLGAKVAVQRDIVDHDAVANDPYGHGTHVAGIAAALTNNGRGVAGACLACKLLVARVINANGQTTSAKLVKGINWSANNDADVINLSLAGPANNNLKLAVDKARATGAVIVAAAGNEGTKTPRYPAAYTKVIAVSATNENDRLAGFSSRGSWVDLSAPGTNILSTGADGGYYEENGTSEAAPFVSALAGLLVSEGKTASEVRQRMESTATDLGPAGNDPYFGHGKINAYGAVR